MPKKKLRPEINIKWRRFKRDPSSQFDEALKKPTAMVIYGRTGSGKSSLVECIAHNYSTVIDLFGSRDNESLAWCRSPRQDSILLLKGSSTDVDCSWPAKNVADVTLEDIGKYKAVISCSAFYAHSKEEWRSLEKLMTRLWYRTHWADAWCLAIREAANLLYSRLSLGENQQEAKSYIIYVLREMRHCGIAPVVDAIRWFSIDIDIRSIAQYTFLKAQGIEGLPKNLHFVYKYYDPFGVMRMGVDKFIVVSAAGPIGDGRNDCPYWHKTESENLLQLLDIRIDHGELPTSDDTSGSHVNEYEHVRIVQARYESPEGERSMEKISSRVGRSSATVYKHIRYHNNAIRSMGECDRCARVKCLLAKQVLD
jgi:energy-coupling factor transporter ATP-binding protein EcfA2